MFLRISGQLELEHRWRWSGEHYAKTSEDWVRNIDNARSEILQLFNRELSMVEAHRTFYRWRIFFLACAETFGFAMDRNGGLVIIYSKRHENSDSPSYSLSPFLSIHFRAEKQSTDTHSWPQWRGPDRDGLIAKNAPWPEKIDSTSLKQSWRIEMGKGILRTHSF